MNKPFICNNSIQQICARIPEHRPHNTKTQTKLWSTQAVTLSKHVWESVSHETSSSGTPGRMGTCAWLTALRGWDYLLVSSYKDHNPERPAGDRETVGNSRRARHWTTCRSLLALWWGRWRSSELMHDSPILQKDIKQIRHLPIVNTVLSQEETSIFLCPQHNTTSTYANMMQISEGFKIKRLMSGRGLSCLDDRWAS